MKSSEEARYVEHWAKEKPDAIAVVDGKSFLTWRQLEDRASQIASALLHRGVTAGDVVAIRTQTRHEWVAIVCALAKISCAMVGMNWRLTPKECRFQLSNSGTTVFICDDANPSLLQPELIGLPLKLCISLDTPCDDFVSLEALIANIPPAPLPSLTEPPLIIYTSGTTGRPKGVAMGQSNHPEELAEYRESLNRYRRNHQGGVALLTMPVHHGSGPAQVWSAIHRGNKIVLLQRFDPEAVLSLIQEHRIVSWTAVPTMLKRISLLPADIIQRYDLSSIAALSVGGSPVSTELKRWALSTFGEDSLQEGYGATEVGMIAAATPDMQRSKPSSCGVPHTNVHIRIRNEIGAVLEQGAIGEIWVKTPVTIRNYYNEPPLDSDVLDSDGFFRTGDVGHMDAEGFLFITDRVKDMIISGGVNIYPAEIEAALRTHPDVLDAAAIGIPDDDFGERVHAFCELVQGAMVDEAALLDACAQRLASYKRPKRIEIVGELPRNAMGKVLKRELRAPFWKDKQRSI